MNVSCDERFHPGWFASSIVPGELAATLLVKLSFKMKHGADLQLLDPEDALPLSGDVYLNDDPNSELIYPSDFVPTKKNADALLISNAHTPGEEPVRQMEVSWSIESFTKTIRVLGPSLGDNESERANFSRASLGYTNAFGGEGYDENPVGRGAKLGTGPQLFTPEDGPSSKVASFRPVSPSWAMRQPSGTYDDVWHKCVRPASPADFDLSVFNSAPKDQQFSEYFRGDENLRFVGMHPQHSVYRTRMPGLRIRSFVGKQTKLDEDPKFEEVSLNLDTLWIDLINERLVLIWRGRTRASSLKLREFSDLFFVAESVAERPGSADSHIDRYRKLIAEQQADQSPEEMDDRAEVEFAKDMADAEAEIKKTETEARDMQATQRLRAEQAGIVVPSAAAEITLDDAILQINQSQIAKDSDAARTAVSTPEGTDELKQLEEEHDAAFEVLDREGVLDRIARGEDCIECDLTDADLSKLDLAGTSFQGSNLTDVDLADANLAGCDLSNTNFCGALLERCKLDSANLDFAEFSEATLDGVSMVNASLEGASFSELDIEDLDASGTTGYGADFSSTVLRRTDFSGSNLPQVDFSNSELSDVNFENAKLNGGQFEEVVAESCSFNSATVEALHASDGSTFRRVDFCSAKAKKANWQNATFERVDFRKAELEMSDFSGCIFKQCDLTACFLQSSLLEEVSLTGARLRQANMFEVSFAESTIVRCSFNDSNLFGTSFLLAKIDSCVFDGALLANSDLSIALERSNEN